MAKGVELTATTAKAPSKGEGETQSPQQQHTEQLKFQSAGKGHMALWTKQPLPLPLCDLKSALSPFVKTG